MEPGAAGQSGAEGALRLAEFEQEVARLGVKSGRAEPERRLVGAGMALVVVGVVLAIGAWLKSNGTNNPADQNDAIIMALTGVVSAVVGVMLWARYSLSRYLRYWLVRVIYEDRQQADRIVDALGRIEQQLSAANQSAPTAKSSV